MMKLKVGDKEYQLKFGYKATLKSHILSRLAKTEEREDGEAMEGVEDTLMLLPEVVLAALQKFHKDEFGYDYDTNEGKGEKVDAVYDVLEQYFDEGGDATELYNRLIGELKTDSFLSKMFDEEKSKEKSKPKKQTTKTEEN